MGHNRYLSNLQNAVKKQQIPPGEKPVLANEQEARQWKEYQCNWFYCQSISLRGDPFFDSGKRGSENTRLCEDMPQLSRMLTQLNGTRYNFVKLEEKLTYGSPVAGRAGEGSTTGSANYHVEEATQNIC